MPEKAAIDKMMSDLRKKFGEDSLLRMSDKAKAVEVIPTGSIMLDRATGIGGYPCGRIVEIAGPEASGKTTLTLHAIANAQKAGGTCAFIDAEHALDCNYAAKIGVQVDDLLINQPDYGEQAIEITRELAGSGNIALIVVDSVAALVPKAELDGEAGDAQMGRHARLMSQAMRQLCAVSAKHNCAILFINQLRSKVGVIYGPPEVATGGNALKYYASMRLDVRRRDARKDEHGEVLGNLTQVKVIKNKLSPPHRTAEFDIVFGVGIDQMTDLITTAVADGIVSKGGSWYSYNGSQIAQGFNNLCKKLAEDQALFQEIRNKCLEGVVGK